MLIASQARSCCNNRNEGMKNRYFKLAYSLHNRLPQRSGKILLKPMEIIERYNLWKAERSGPPYRPSHRKIIIDITSACNLGCVDCNRSCASNQAPSQEHMGLDQIEKFIKQSVENNRVWKEILIEGGEPTQHPHIREIIELLLIYRKRYSPGTFIKVQTNGFGERCGKVLESLPEREVYIHNSGKSSVFQQEHWDFNLAPCDSSEYDQMDFSTGCHLPACYGLGLTCNGYYPHPICGGIDRVYGWDIGRKMLPDVNDSMRDHFEKLCPVCGFFRVAAIRNKDKGKKLKFVEIERETVSESWQKAYRQYHVKAPHLKRY